MDNNGYETHNENEGVGAEYRNYYQQSNITSNSSLNQSPKKSGTGKKILAASLVGLSFGVCVALGFEGITIAKDALKERFGSKEKAQIESTQSEEEEKSIIEKAIDEVVGDVDGTEEATKAAEEHKKIKDVQENTVLSPSIAKTTVTDVTEVVKECMPSVVAVNNKYISKMNYFGQIYSQEGEAAGSGIIVGQNDTELLIVTNHHVVDGAEEITVTFADDSQVNAQLKGTDESRDLAVIAVQMADIEDSTADSIAVASLGDSEALTVGEPVIAIGNSLGYGQSVTAGVVSALDRTINVSSSNGQVNEDEEAATFIQTDAAINPGNSGGALLNMYGQVIGINSNKIGGTAVEGMGYAIPISDAKPIIEELMNKQTKLKVAEESKGYLGITGINVEQQYSEVYGIPIGVYVSSVTEGSGAEAAGLVKGDIIVAVNGEKIETMDELKEQLEYYTAGTTVEVTLMQGSPTGYQSVDVNVTLGENPNGVN